MTISPAEQTQKAHFDVVYARTRVPVMRAIERRVCGCAYGGSSWTTRAEADIMSALLSLAPGIRLLDIGAGTGWPGIYLSDTTGCDVTLADMPLEGLRIAAERIVTDELADRCRAVVADGADLPFATASFDAISHSDVLCCLQDKTAVLKACRRVARADGRMVFSAIMVAPGLTSADYRRAVASGPEFVEAEASYPDMLRDAGWMLQDGLDQTADYVATCQSQVEADQANETDLKALIGAEAFDERLAEWQTYLEALTGGLLRRERFTATPAV